jgi:hypothetical protein
MFVGEILRTKAPEVIAVTPGQTMVVGTTTSASWSSPVRPGNT